MHQCIGDDAGLDRHVVCEADDHYRVQLWPGEAIEPRVLKQRPTPVA
jgi:hypothetical protein